MAIAPLIIRITALGAAALARTAAAMRAFGASVSGAARAASGRATAAFARLTAVLRALGSAALRAAIIIGGVLRRALRSAANAAGELARTVALFALRWIAILGTLGPPIVALGAALAQLLPLVTLLAPAAIAAGASLLVLALGFKGVGSALSAGLSGDVEEYTEALKKLTPQAREFVKHLVIVAKHWRDLRSVLQEKLFKALSLEVGNTSNALGRIAITWLPKIAELFNNFFFALMKGAQSKEFARQMDVIFKGVSDFIFGALHAVRMLGRAFLDIAEVAAPSFGRLGAHIGIAAEKFANWIDRISKDGTLARWIDNAKEIFGQFMDIGREFGRILGAIFRGTDEGGFLENLRNSLDEIADFLEGEQGQDMIQTFSDIASAIAGAARTLGDFVRWIQDAIAWLRQLFRGDSDIVPLANVAAGAIRGFGAAFDWIGNVIGRLGMLVAAVRNSVNLINAALAAIRTTVFIDIITRRSDVQGYARPIASSRGGGTAKVMAHGGDVRAGMPYIVGDAGKPELFVPNQAGRVIPRVPTGGITLTYSGGRSGAFESLFYRELNEAIRTGRLKVA